MISLEAYGREVRRRISRHQIDDGFAFQPTIYIIAQVNNCFLKVFGGAGRVLGDQGLEPAQKVRAPVDVTNGVEPVPVRSGRRLGNGGPGRLPMRKA